jgi:hypothetical protein
MKTRKMDRALSFVLPSATYKILSDVAYEEETTVGAVVRDFLDAGMRAKGLA